LWQKDDNTQLNNQTLSKYKSTTPKILKYIKTPNRFTTYIDDQNYTYIQFGANTDNFENTVIIPNPNNVGVGLSNLNKLNISLDGTNVLKSNSYGYSPSNTTLTIQYIVGGGLDSNVNSETINTVENVNFQNNDAFISDSEFELLDRIKNSLRVVNPEPSTGGGGSESNEQIRQNALLNFSSQNRMITSEDILLRTYSMSPKFGNVSKAYVESNSKKLVSYEGLIRSVISDNNETIDLTNLQPLDRRKFIDSVNPFTNNLYVLSYDNNKKLTKLNEATILNLKNYLSKYKMLTDRINIIDGYIINIGVEFKISVFSGFNKRSVLDECLDTVYSFFDIDNWSFNQPINLSQLSFEIMKTEGVQTVNDIKVNNLTIDDGDYSAIAYNLSIANQNNIIYPSKDPSVFEVKYPSDIKGIVV